MFNDKCSCYICFIYVLRVEITWVVVLNANPSTYVELTTFCTFRMALYFLVSLEQVKEIVAQK
jgi:hypothetical protein